MKKGKNKSSDTEELRKKALEKLQRRVPNVEDLSAHDMQTLVHELQVYQMELEIQNEELRQTQLNLEKSQARYCEFYDHAPVGYVSLDRKGWILKANLTAARQLGIDQLQLLKQPFSKSIHEDWPIFQAHLHEVFETKKPHQCELSFMHSSGSIFHARLDSIVMESRSGGELCRTVITDITQFKQAEEQIKKSAQEKEVMLREIHHRVRNNLQVISSLLNIQAMHLGDKKVLNIFI